jgi:diguanylate cyclase
MRWHGVQPLIRSANVLGPLIFDDTSHPAVTNLVHANHHLGLVVLALFVAFISCCAAFYMGHTNRKASALSHRRASLMCASLVLGLGIWAMHFIGMLAMQLPTPVRYDPVSTALSIVPGILAAWLALLALRSEAPSNARILSSGAIVGLGIAVMHYSGIAAMELDGQLFFHTPAFVLSAVFGVGFAMLSFWTHRWVYRRQSDRPLRYGGLLAPALMTVAIASMHFISMYALRVQLLDNHSIWPSDQNPGKTNQMLSFAVATMTGVVFLVLGLTNALLRYRDLWQAVAARDARLNAMLDTAEDGFISIDAQGHIQDFNTSAQRIFGYSKAQVMGRNISMLMPSPLAEQHDGHLAAHADKPKRAISVKSREVLGRHKDGRHVPLQLAIGKALTPNGIVFVGYLQDISVRKRTDAQLRIAASVFHHVREGVAIVDANHNISDVNPAFLRLMEMHKEQCVGRSLEQLYEDADTPPDLSKLWQTVATQQYWQSEIMFTRSDGRMWIQRLSISPVLNELQRPHHFIAVISDVSERQGLEVMLPHADLHDSATGLPAPKLLMDRLSTALLHARRKASHVGVLVVTAVPVADTALRSAPMDMDGALRLLAQLLQQQLRGTDTFGRLGPTQLAVLLPGVKDSIALNALVQRLWRSLQDSNAGYAKYGVHGLQLGFAFNVRPQSSATELVEEARQVQHTWTPSPSHIH